MKLGQLTLIALTTAVTAACATTYEAPKTDAPHATLMLKKGYKTGVGLGTGTQQEYSAYEGPKCAEPSRLASFTWTNGEEKEKRVTPDVKLIMGASTNYYGSSGGYWNGTAYIPNQTVNSCRSFASFTPRDGARYKIVQSETGPMACEFSVIDMATDSAPSDYQTGELEVCTDLAANSQK